MPPQRKNLNPAMSGSDVDSPKLAVAARIDRSNIHSELDNAFDSDDDIAAGASATDFDLHGAIPDLRQKLAEENAAAEAELQREAEEQEERERHQQVVTVPWNPQYAVRRSAETTGSAENEQDIDEDGDQGGRRSLPVSPFAVDFRYAAQSAPATSTSFSSTINGTDERSSRTTESLPEEGVEEVEVPVQSFEDISLEEDGNTTPQSLQTPISTSSRMSPKPLSIQNPTDGTNDGSASNRNSLQPVEAHAASAPSFQQQFKRSKKSGRTTLQQVLSKTRPVHLPPKPKEEDIKHLKSWEEMMKQSRLAEEKRKQELARKRQARERMIEESMPIWQNEIMPNFRKVRRDLNLRRIWWRGIPPKLRGDLWEKAIGNPLQMSKDMYRSCSARAQRAILRGTFPTNALESIEKDMDSTLPTLHLFHRETGVMREDLRDLMLAWMVASLCKTMGAARIGAMLLLNIPLPNTFLAMRNLMDRHCLRSLYGGPNAQDDVEAYYRIFDTLLADSLPKVYFNFKQHHISPSEYLTDWLLTMFLDHLPFEACARLWDAILLEDDDSFLFRAALAIVGVLESRLLFPDREELLQVLRGESKAAVQVARRVAATGGKDLEIVDQGARYEVFGLDEETLWEHIEASEEWWRETTWSRLIQRELPDL
ncbi:hypothetical protein PIIN_00998 [Serendipita indica DSM 11827]|uniref:Rab-GAP TBC domain-containing protein n=1 Tax=Serendipita indica (strain DSM 11827) TaxID=1109443 RepID=G4T734_SERID|nr:hypothetical protein PIIN_00998 [Serendipita indica DSM 11827]